MKYEINPISVSALNPTDNLTITTMSAEHPFKGFDSAIIHPDTENEFHAKPDGVVEFKMTVIQDSKNRLSPDEYTLTIEGVGIYDFRAIDLDGGEIDNNTISEEDKSCIVDKVCEFFIKDSEFRHNVLEKFTDFLDKKNFRKLKNINNETK